jgi:predicted nucleotide-binding protein (sugar kinase/HSP70/actin superfamily)
MLYCFYNQIFKAAELGTSKKTARWSRFGINVVQLFLAPINRALKKSRRFEPFVSIIRSRITQTDRFHRQ